MRLSSILVPLDGSRFSEHAIPYALKLAKAAGIGVWLVHVRDPYDDPDLYLSTAAEDDRRANEQAWNHLNGLVKELKSLSQVSVQAAVLRGPISGMLTEFALRNGTDLIVMTSHGRGALSRFWLGSVASELIQKSPAALLLIRPGDGEPGNRIDPPLNRILIPLDGSVFSEHIIPLATSVGSLTNAHYRLVQVVSSHARGTWNRLGPGPGVEPGAEHLAEAATIYLRNLTSHYPELKDAEVNVSTSWPPAPAILAEADAYRADLIALETQGRGGLMKFLMGSVADKVVRGANMPVLLRRPPGR